MAVTRSRLKQRSREWEWAGYTDIDRVSPLSYEIDDQVIIHCGLDFFPSKFAQFAGPSVSVSLSVRESEFNYVSGPSSRLHFAWAA